MFPSRLLKALLLSLAASTSALPTSSPSSQSHILTVAHQERGLLSIALDTSASETPLRILKTTPAGVRPNWLCRSGKNVYAISRTGYPEADINEGGIFAFVKKCKKGALRLIGDVSTNGEGGCHCDVRPGGRLLSVANIDGATVSLHPRFSNGTVGASSHVFSYNLTSPGPGHDGSQEQSNPHQTIFSPSGNFMLVPDRGADLVYVYHTPSSGYVTRLDDIELPKGTGPRHAAFWRISETQSLMILIGELDNTLRVYKVNEKKGEVDVSLVQTVSTLGDGLKPTLPEGHNLAAEVAISPDGRFVYASNRNTTGFESDFLAIYSLEHDSAKPSLSWTGRNDTHGKLPRHFAIGGGKTGEYVAVLNQVTNDLQVFERDIEGGMLGERIGKLVLGETTTDTDVGPIHVLWD